MLLDRTGPLPDPWTRVDGDAELPAGPAIVDLDRLDAVDHRPLGVHLPNTADAASLADVFDRLALVSVAFPSFADGRGFSIGKRLRELGFAGRLRATGPVIPDQFAYLLECGFDEVALPETQAERQPPEHWAAALARASERESYQRGRTGARASILDQRRKSHGHA